MNENIKTSVHKYYNAKVPILSHWSTARNKAATLSPEEYEFLYEIATTNPVYSKKAELLRNALHHYQDRKSINSPLPLIFKQAVYLLAYDLCRGDYYDVAQKKALEDVGLAHNSFSKWKMEPKEDYLLNQCYKDEIPLSMPIPNHVKKNFSLVNLVWDLSKQIHYKTFVDVFCGSGTVTLGIPKYHNRNYYMNDIDSSRTNLIDVLRDKKNSKEFLNLLYELIDKIKGFSDENMPALTASFSTIFPGIENWKIIALRLIYDILNKESSESTLPKSIADIVIPVKKIANVAITDIEKYINITCVERYIAECPDSIQIVFAQGLTLFFEKFLKEISDNSLVYEPLSYAIATVYTDTFKTTGRKKLNESSLTNFFSKMSNWSNVIGEFQRFNITTLNQHDYEAIEQFNSEDTLLYLDSPYIGVSGYPSYSYKEDDFRKLYETLKTFKGKWIFSCRANVVFQYPKNPEDINEYSKKDSANWEPNTPRSIQKQKEFQEKVDAIRLLLDLYKPLAPNVAFFNRGDNSDAFYFEYACDEKGKKEVMFFNFEATAPDMKRFYKLVHSKESRPNDGIYKDSFCKIISYEEFYPLAQSGLDHVDGTCC